MNERPGGAWLGGTLVPGRADRPLLSVVKFGGSLMTRPDWPELARALVAGFPNCLLVVGGGTVVEGLRALDATAPGDPGIVHRLALDGMRITARFVAARLRLETVAEPAARGTAVLDVATWLDAAPARHEGLEASWSVTSDSLAARVAAVHGAGLVLAKSVPPPARDLRALAAAGWVDASFPAVARGLTDVAWRAPAS